jgi:hypothetical protein
MMLAHCGSTAEKYDATVLLPTCVLDPALTKRPYTAISANALG